MNKVRFGVLSTARIGMEKVIPALQKADKCEISAIASRNLKKAEEAAGTRNIPKFYGSYEALLDDPDIDAVYIPLPNHMHVPWSIRCLEAGKHVLCEKPIGLDTADAQNLLDASKRFPELKVMEAFMYRHHPRWKKAVELIRSGKIGQIRTIHSLFSYNNTDPANIRNKPDMGGGGLMDIGCYSVSLSRWIYNAEPNDVKGTLYFDPDFKTDYLTSGILGFDEGTAVFSCSTRCYKGQYVKIFGDKGKIEMDMPFNYTFDEPTYLTVTNGSEQQRLEFEPCNHFTIQGDVFSEAILNQKPVPVPIEDAIRNMDVIDKLKQ